MHFSKLTVAALLPAASVVSGTNIVVSNDDGWAEANVRALYHALMAAGNRVVLSAPADNESGTGSSDAPPGPRTSPCEFDSCPAGSAGHGSDPADTQINYVNSYPVTSMRYGIQTVSSQWLSSNPELAVAGFNVGANLGKTVLVSGTVGAATEAVKEGVPAIAFSGSTGSQISYKTSPMPNYVGVYTALAVNVTETLIASGKPFLPSGIWLNVNFPESTSSKCMHASDFRFVLSRIASSGEEPSSSSSKAGAEVRRRGGNATCGGPLPAETDVVDTSGCYASISVGVATTKGDANSTTQQLVQKKLDSILSCLPSSS